MLFTNRNFTLLWTGQIVSQLGDKFYSIALAWWVLELTNSPAAMGLLLVAATLPELLFGLVAGGFIDRLNRKAIIIIADVFRGMAVLVITLLFWNGSLELWHIYAGAVIISLASAFFDPAVMAIIPQIVHKDKLPQANSFSQMVTGLSAMAGPVLGATLVSSVGFGPVFLANGLSYIMSAVLEGFIILPDKFAKLNPKTNFVEDVKQGIKFISKSKPVLVILMVIGIVHVFFGSLVVALPFVANSLSGDGVRNLGYLETAMGLGMILGAVVIGQCKMKDMHGSYLFAVIFAAGFCFALLGVINGAGFVAKYSYITIMLLIGVAVAVASVYWRSLLQVHVPNKMAGRVFSVSTIIADVTLPVSFGVFGIILDHMSIAYTLAGCGIILMLVSTFLLIKYRYIVRS